MSDNYNAGGTTKADLILAKLDRLTGRINTLEERVNVALAKKAEDKTDAKLSSIEKGVSAESKIISTQLESVYVTLANKIARLTAELNALKGGALGVDLDELSSRVAAKIVIPETATAEIDEDALADRIAEKLPAPAPAEAETLAPVAAAPEIDYDLIAEKVAAVIPAQEVISPDYIASKVAEQIVIPDGGSQNAELDLETLSRKVADKIVIPVAETTTTAQVDEDSLADKIAEKLKGGDTETEEKEEVASSSIDEEALAENIASRLNFSLSDELIAAAVVRNLSDAIDSEEIADCVAKKVGTVSPEQFDVLVDDDGCDSLARAVEEKLDYDVICAAIAEKLAPVINGIDGVDIDAEELAKTLSEKLSVNANLNEDVIADKAAAVLSNYLPEIDADDIADKVVAGVIPALPPAPTVDSEGIAASVSEKIVESQEDKDYDIVIDEEGLDRITSNVSDRIKEENDAKFEKLNEDMSAVKEEYSARFDKVDGDIAEIKALLLSGVVVAGATEIAASESSESEELVTVSDIVDENETAENETDETVTDINETLSDGEIMPDGIEGGVDFANMMKYNRSFIARIIQGTDDQKNYYGRVKTALLSYKKVNSNVAWGAERFNKGRETIARFKIRGKTLCLYLALDPNEFPVSVYHHVDVSDNKSMHGTPMMVKIKSPLGVKKAIRLIDEMLSRRNGEKRVVAERDYAAMYPYETIEELIDDGLVKDVTK